MDLWVVAAITGAGYAAKYLQNFARDKEGSSGLMPTSSVRKKPDSPALIPRFEDNAALLQNSTYRRSTYNLLDGRFGETKERNIPNVETVSTSGFDGEISDSYREGFEASARAMGTLGGHRSGQNSLRSRHFQPQYLKPLSSLESCLMAQIYKEHSGTEDHILVPMTSPCIPAFRPLVVTDGTRVISRPSFDSSSVQVRDGNKKVHSKKYPDINEAVIGGIPMLPKRGSREYSKLSNIDKGKDQIERLSSISEMPYKMQMSSEGPLSGAALFCLGVSIGVTFNTLANNTEVTKLKDVLKQTENLVQDLQEELDMKDSLTVKELVSENDIFSYEREGSVYNKKPMAAYSQSDSEVLINYDVERSDTHKAPENLESMNQIEAELEAELERLELNIKGSTLHTKFSNDDDDDELDADIVAELVQGELRADVVSRKPLCDHSGDSSSSSSTNPCSPKHAVSPRELSMRLHQLIQSRLEHRIMELESALEKSRKRVKKLESGQGVPHIDSSSSSSSRGSPITIENGYPLESQTNNELPLVMNLSGEALDAYYEAFEELNKVNGSEYSEEHDSATNKESQEEQLFHRSMVRLTNQMKSSSLLFRPTVVNDEAYATNCTTFEQRELFSFDEDNDEDDTSLLIKQIVEKTRQGSSAILHAHKAMVSLDSNDK